MLNKIKRYFRLKRAKNRPRPEYVERALNDAWWLMMNYSPNDINLYLNTLTGKISKIKNQRIEELENQLNELRRL